MEHSVRMVTSAFATSPNRPSKLVGWRSSSVQSVGSFLVHNTGFLLPSLELIRFSFDEFPLDVGSSSSSSSSLYWTFEQSLLLIDRLEVWVTSLTNPYPGYLDMTLFKSSYDFKLFELRLVWIRFKVSYSNLVCPILNFLREELN